MGVYLNSEQKYDEMLQILDRVHNYVPSKSLEQELEIGLNTYTVTKEAFHQILFGGDQLTTARCRGCQAIRINSATESQKLSGLLPVIEDWHTKVVLLEVNTVYLQ